ncbi:MAG: SUMF1/EgtB/PvdO family nonheme iron enzyme [Anaerolineales bacterium]|nr:SUMF1/EgtB/PvdO family nonheme iron enzyme [Anaerolineales bacterium]
MLPDLKNTILHILDKDGKSVVGMGFLVTEQWAVTCAHVVEDARSGAGQSIGYSFQGHNRQEAYVDHDFWNLKEDVAFLKLTSLPEGLEPALLGSSGGTFGHPFTTFGAPLKLKEIGGYGTIADRVEITLGRELLQLAGAKEITRGFSGAPLLDRKTRRVVGMITAITQPDESGRLTETAFAIPSETLKAICAEIQFSDLCPYRNLEVFTAEDADFFFGRESVINRLFESLNGAPRFLAVLGPSGSGKSSVVQAGLLAQLRAGKLPGSETWKIVITRPSEIPTGLGSYEAWLHGLKGPSRLCLVIDQFEEFLLETESTQVQESVDWLVDFLESPSELTIVITMRNDFYGRLSRQAPRLMAWLERGLVNIPPEITPEELKLIVEAPATSIGLTFEPGLVDAIVRDAIRMVPASGEDRHKSRNTILPLLEFALSQLWERRHDGVLTHDAYQTIGGVTGGLTQWAERAYYSIKDEFRPLARRLLISLVYLGDKTQGLPDSRRRRSFTELYELADKLEVDYIVGKLTNSETRLLVTTAEPKHELATVELIHEALLWEWALLKQWIQTDRAYLTWYQGFEKLVQRWVASNFASVARRDRTLLLQKHDLDQANFWLSQTINNLSAEDRRFIRLSHREQHLNQWRLPFAILMVLLLIGVVISGFRYSLKIQALRATPRVDFHEATFIVGDNAGLNAFSQGQWSVKWPAYAITQYEVSNHLYCLCTRAGVCTEPEYGQSSVCQQEIASLPVSNVSVERAQRYCTWLGGRLPTEVEWEHAARGQEGFDYPGSNEPPDKANIGSAGTLPVTAPGTDETREGVTGLAGNVSEWTLSPWLSYADPGYWENLWPNLSSITQGKVVIRGGSWFDSDPGVAHVSLRVPRDPDVGANYVGFRCVFGPELSSLSKEVIQFKALTEMR